MALKERCAVDWSPSYTVEVREDLYEGAWNEDGERDIESAFYLVATCTSLDKKFPHKYGTRWASPRRHDTEADAKRERRMLARDFDPVKAEWYDADPMYGSEAWTPEFESELAYRERMEEGF